MDERRSKGSNPYPLCLDLSNALVSETLESCCTLFFCTRCSKYGLPIYVNVFFFSQMKRITLKTDCVQHDHMMMANNVVRIYGAFERCHIYYLGDPDNSPRREAGRMISILVVVGVVLLNNSRLPGSVQGAAMRPEQGRENWLRAQSWGLTIGGILIPAGLML